jgi:hypothetical protein
LHNEIVIHPISFRNPTPFSHRPVKLAGPPVYLSVGCPDPALEGSQLLMRAGFLA